MKKLRMRQLTLSTKLILSMAGLVLLSAVFSLLISNIIIHNQTRQLEESLQRISTQMQEVKKQNAQPASVTVEQIRQIVGDSVNTPENTLLEVRHALSNSDGLNSRAFLRLTRESGFPTSDPSCFLRSSSIADLDSGRATSPPPSPNGSPPPDKCSTTADGFYSYPVGQSIALGCLFSAVCAVALGFLLSRRITGPLRALEQASERIADGNYENEIKLGGSNEISQLAHSFNRMAQALHLTEQKRKDLVADVSHELRTPLASIQGYTEVLRDGLVPSRERQEEILDHILKEVKHLTGMVNSMREWVNSEQMLEHLDLEVMPVQYITDLVVERFRPVSASKGVELKLELAQPELQVRADADALSRVLSNLVDNALRYTPEGGSITLKIGQEFHGKISKANFEVCDTGCGIAPEHLPFIFERFYRVDRSRDRATGGSGLGLAIVRDTVHTLGGDVKIESTLGQGTRVLFDLPSVLPTRSSRKRRVVAEVN
ncbi:MAG: ATP-binding protein [Chloroflexota bacterium]